MTSIKVKFRPSSIAGREGTIYYQIIHERKIRQLLSDYRILACEWDERRSMVSIGRNSDRQSLILSIAEHIRRDRERLTNIIRKLETEGAPYTTDDIIDRYKYYTDNYSLFHFMGRTIVKLQQNGQIRTSETYKAALNSFKKFRENKDIMLDCITAEIMKAYEMWLRRRGVTPNTLSFYARILRALYNRAVEQGIIEDRYPFKHVYTGIDKTVKRALPLSALRKIKDLNLSSRPVLDFSRDIFLMSFYLRGMSFIDMAFLQKSDLRNNRITYRRHKTGQRLVIGWTKQMQNILDKYPENTTRYLLPIIRSSCANERCAYRNASYNINYNLKKIAEIAGIDIPLTLYVARHSWASVAKTKGIPLSVISEGMGHDSETTTRIYLASLDSSVIDDANSLILESL